MLTLVVPKPPLAFGGGYWAVRLSYETCSFLHRWNLERP